jgi:hypothetical protein
MGGEHDDEVVVFTASVFVIATAAVIIQQIRAVIVKGLVVVLGVSNEKYNSRRRLPTVIYSSKSSQEFMTIVLAKSKLF